MTGIVRPKGAVLLDQLNKEISKLKLGATKTAYYVTSFSPSLRVLTFFPDTYTYGDKQYFRPIMWDGHPVYDFSARDSNLIQNTYNDNYVFFFKKRAEAYLKQIQSQQEQFRLRFWNRVDI